MGLGVSASKMLTVSNMWRGVVCVEKLPTHKDAGGDEEGRWRTEKLLTFEQDHAG